MTVGPQSEPRGTVGIYIIRHNPTGRVYVGQTNNFSRRWREHRTDLNNGIHRNRGLQDLWIASGEDAFSFQVHCEAPSGIQGLQLQRWLAREETKVIAEHTAIGLVFNIAEPETVSTTRAHREWMEEFQVRMKIRDQRLSEKRREIKLRLAPAIENIETEESRLSAIELSCSNLSICIRRATGWRRLFYGRPVGFDVSVARQQLACQEREAKILEAKVRSMRDEISRLQNEYGNLGRQFSKLLRNRAAWSGVRGLPEIPLPED